jgi:hypothetical protein
MFIMQRSRCDSRCTGLPPPEAAPRRMPLVSSHRARRRLSDTIRIAQSVKAAIGQASPLPFELKVLEALLSGAGWGRCAAAARWHAAVCGVATPLRLIACALLPAPVPCCPPSSPPSCARRDGARVRQQEQAAGHRG